MGTESVRKESKSGVELKSAAKSNLSHDDGYNSTWPARRQPCVTFEGPSLVGVHLTGAQQRPLIG